MQQYKGVRVLLYILTILSQLTLGFAPLVFLIKFLYDIFHYDMSFWVALWQELLLFILIEGISALVFLFSLVILENYYNGNKTTF